MLRQSELRLERISRMDFLPTSRNTACNCALIGLNSLMAYFGYESSSSWSELVFLVAHSDISTLKTRFGENNNFRITDKHGNSPLHLSVIFKKYDVFDYLLTLEGLELDVVNNYGHTPMFLAVLNDLEYVVAQLIKKGVDVNTPNMCHCTPLHAAAMKFNTKIFEILVENGADLNFRNIAGKTALCQTCQYGSLDSIDMLLYYGANARIPDNYGVLPLTAAMNQYVIYDVETIPMSHLECFENLFNHTFDGEKMKVHLSTLTVAMKINSPLFPQILENVESVWYKEEDLIALGWCAVMIDPDYFKMFLREHSHIVEEILLNPHDLHYRSFYDPYVDRFIIKLLNFIDLVCSYQPALDFIKGSIEFGYFVPCVVHLFEQKKISADLLEECIYFVYSRGLPCQFAHVIAVYSKLGFCRILKFMLDLDIVLIFKKHDCIIPHLLCDINMTLEKIIDLGVDPSLAHGEALKFFANRRFRNFLRPIFGEFLDRTPKMPSLVELSRDAARQHIIDLFNIKEAKDFYRLVKRMPISEVHKKILIYEKELYRISLPWL